MEDYREDRGAGWSPDQLSDFELVNKMMQSPPIGEKFARLWRGGASGYGDGYDTDNYAALALCGQLAYWTGYDRERTERLFRQSGMFKRVRPSTIAATVDKAIEGGKEFSPPLLVTKESKDTKEVKETEERKDQCSPRATELAVELANEQRADVYTDSFRLARKLRALSEGGPDQFEDAVQAYCATTGYDFDDFWLYFLGVWGKVRLAEGEHPLDWALGRAREEPVANLPPSRPERYHLLAGMAYHLSVLRGDGQFQLPIGEHLTALLVANDIIRHRMEVSRALEALQNDGVITLRDATYSKQGGKARVFAWVWPPARDAAQAA